MNSFVLRVRNLSTLVENILKSEPIGFHYHSTLRRTLFKCKNCSVSVSVQSKKFKAYNVGNETLSSRYEKNLGKIVDLGEDFEDMKANCEEITRGRKKRVKKESKLTGSHSRNQTEWEKHFGKLQITDKNKSNTERSNRCKKNESLFSSVMTGIKSNQFKKKDKVVLEGKRIIHDAISAGFMPELIFYCRESDLEQVNVPDGIKAVKVSYKKFKLWADVVTPQGVAGIFKVADFLSVRRNNFIPLTIICDNIREPGNLGTILRIAVGVGCEKVLLTKGCVDIWNPKVIRGGAGAHFHIPVVNGLQWSDIESEFSENSKVFVADLNSQTVNDTDGTVDTEKKTGTNTFAIKRKDFQSLPVYCYSSVKYTNESTVIVIGGETQGICSEAYEFAAKRKGARIFIPMNNEIDSLNNSVALGILVYEFKRQLDSMEDSHLAD